MVLEDEGLVMMLLEDMLAELGAATIDSAMTVPDAVSRAIHDAIDVAVLDVNVAGVRSYPVAEALRARGVPFLFVTGYGASGHEPAWRGSPTLTKPIRLSELGAALSQML